MDCLQIVDLDNEKPEDTRDRILDFCEVLEYPVRLDDFIEKQFIQGDRDVIYPILYYMVVNYQDLQVKAHENRFLFPIGLPDDLSADLEIKQ